MSKYIKNRFILIGLLIVIFVAISLTSRTILLFANFDQLDFGFVILIKLFLVGLFYDFVAAIYYVAPFAVYVALMPDRIFNNTFHKYMLWLFLFVNINLLVFNAFSEWFFWDEFGKRFNFIAVDYLVYTQEVIHNILESYPIPLLLTAVFIISSVIFYFIYKKRAVLGFAFVLAVLCVLLCARSPHPRHGLI